MANFQLSIFSFQLKSPERTTVPRQAVECEARNPCKKDYTIIRVPKVRQNVNHQKQISHHIELRMLSKTIYTHLEMTSFYDDLIGF